MLTLDFLRDLMKSDREKRIAEHKQQIPRAYRGIYQRATEGKSLRLQIIKGVK